MNSRNAIAMNDAELDSSTSLICLRDSRYLNIRKTRRRRSDFSTRKVDKDLKRTACGPADPRIDQALCEDCKQAFYTLTGRRDAVGVNIPRSKSV